MTHLTMVYKWHRQYIATKDELFRVRKQRDDLLAACEAVLANGFRETDMQSWAAPLVTQLRAAIANAKGAQ